MRPQEWLSINLPAHLLYTIKPLHTGTKIKCYSVLYKRVACYSGSFLKTSNQCRGTWVIEKDKHRGANETLVKLKMSHYRIKIQQCRNLTNVKYDHRPYQRQFCFFFSLFVFPQNFILLELFKTCSLISFSMRLSGTLRFKINIYKNID